MNNPTTTGEWTVKTLARYTELEDNHNYGALLDAINAALAALQQDLKAALDRRAEAVQQLAADRERRDGFRRALEQRISEVDQLRDQLDAEREKHKTLAHAFESERELRKRHEDQWEQCAMLLHEQERQTDQLREQLAAAVEALEYYAAQSLVPKIARAALAKIGEK